MQDCVQPRLRLCELRDKQVLRCVKEEYASRRSMTWMLAGAVDRRKRFYSRMLESFSVNNPMLV